MKMDFIHYFGLISLISCFTKSAVSICTFPEEWNSLWYDSRTEEVSMNASSAGITGWQIKPFGLQAGLVLSWTCVMENSTHYAFRSDNLILAYTGDYIAYICLEIFNITRYSYYYYVLGDIEPNADFQRIKLINNDSAQPSNLDEFCSYTAGPPVEEFHVLVKQGFETEAKQFCPEPVLGIFNYTYPDGSTDHCVNDTELNVCTDRKTMTYNYTLCNTTQGYSLEGELYCLVYLQDDDTYFLSVLNPGIVNGSDYHRFTCYAIQMNGTEVFASHSPGDCEIGQTPFDKPSSGAVFELSSYAFTTTTSTILITRSNTRDSDTTTYELYTAGFSYGCWYWIILLIIGLILLHLILICIIAYCRRNRKRKKNSVHSVKEVNDNAPMPNRGLPIPNVILAHKLPPIEKGPTLRLPNGIYQNFNNPLPPISPR